MVVIGITLVQERKTEHALAALRDLASPRALVVRTHVAEPTASFGGLAGARRNGAAVPAHLPLNADCSGISRRKSSRAVTLERDGNTAVLSVRDDGIGIPAEQLSTIFDLFFQADRSLDRNPGGLGLGPTLVRRLVELHDGSVEARSSGRDQGSEFVVRLPLSRAPLAAATPPRAVAPPSAPRRTLVVDDNLEAAESLTMLLQLDHHDVCMGSDGRAALAAAADFAPEIVLLDIGLPGIDGYEVAAELRARPGGDEIALVAVTGYGRAEDRQRAREARFDHYLLKPIDFAALAEILAA